MFDLGEREGDLWVPAFVEVSVEGVVYEIRPSPFVLEALLRELGPSPRMFGFWRRRGRRDDFGL